MAVTRGRCVQEVNTLSQGSLCSKKHDTADRGGCQEGRQDTGPFAGTGTGPQPTRDPAMLASEPTQPLIKQGTEPAHGGRACFMTARPTQPTQEFSSQRLTLHVSSGADGGAARLHCLSRKLWQW